MKPNERLVLVQRDPADRTWIVWVGKYGCLDCDYTITNIPSEREAKERADSIRGYKIIEPSEPRAAVIDFDPFQKEAI